MLGDALNKVNANRSCIYVCYMRLADPLATETDSFDVQNASIWRYPKQHKQMWFDHGYINVWYMRLP
jgi:hypothetical protein